MNELVQTKMDQRTASRQLPTPRGRGSQTALPNCIRLGIIRGRPPRTAQTESEEILTEFDSLVSQKPTLFG